MITAPLTPIEALEWRRPACFRGRVRAMRVRPWGDVASLECLVVDETGGVLLVFLGRRKVGGVELGRELVAAGTAGASRGYLAVLNPVVELLPS